MSIPNKRIYAILSLVLGLALSRCAIVRVPTGGEKDIIAPKLLSTFPLNGSTNFHGDKVILVFNEPIVGKDISKQLLISPRYSARPDIVVKRNKVTVTFPEPLKSNTTYFVNFRKGIGDETEGNLAKQPEVIFSTGNLIDTGAIQVHITDAYSGRKAINTLIGLYPESDTLNINKHKPEHFGYTDSTGTCNIEYINGNPYKLFAFTDVNEDLIYNDKAEKLGWYDSLVIPSKFPIITITTSTQDSKAPELLSSTGYNHAAELIFSENISKLDLIDRPSGLFYTVEEKKAFFFSKTLDSVKIRFTVSDSASNVAKDTAILYFNNPKKKLPFLNERLYKIPNTDLLPENPIIVLLRDSSIKVNTDKWTFRADSISRKITWIKRNDTLSAKLPKGKNYILTIPKQSINDVLDSTNKTSDTIKLKTVTLNEENFGTITVTVKNPKHTDILLITDEDGKIIKQVNPKATNKFTYLPPATYRAKLLTDTNSNGVWDIANYSKRQHAEIVNCWPNPIPLKANWEIEDIEF